MFYIYFFHLDITLITVEIHFNYQKQQIISTEFQPSHTYGFSLSSALGSFSIFLRPLLPCNNQFTLALSMSSCIIYLCIKFVKCIVLIVADALSK